MAREERKVPVRARAASDRGAIMEQTRSEILKTIPYGFYKTIPYGLYITGAAAAHRRASARGAIMEQTRSEILKTIPYGFYKTIPYGFYITGVVGANGEANGFTTCWVSQVSFNPQQVIVAVRKDRPTHALTEQGGVFSLNFLDTEQEDLARRFTEPLENR